MDRKELQLELVASLTETLFGHGHTHYGYWPDGAPEVMSAEALAAAQVAYFDLLVRTIPAGTRSILDVGSGSGATALGLSHLGYRTECVCPSEWLNDLARQKLPPDVPVHLAKFEDFESKRRFELCLFAESFHYIDLQRALAQAARYASRHVLIFDYFRRVAGPSATGARGTHRAFRAALAAQGVFSVSRDDDLTAAILPTFEVVDHLKDAHVGPLVRRLRARLAAAYPLRWKLADWLFGRRLDELERPGHRAERFASRFEYRLILLERAQEPLR